MQAGVLQRLRPRHCKFPAKLLPMKACRHCAYDTTGIAPKALLLYVRHVSRSQELQISRTYRNTREGGGSLQDSQPRFPALPSHASTCKPLRRGP